METWYVLAYVLEWREGFTERLLWSTVVTASTRTEAKTAAVLVAMGEYYEVDRVIKILPLTELNERVLAAL